MIRGGRVRISPKGAGVTRFHKNIEAIMELMYAFVVYSGSASHAGAPGAFSGAVKNHRSSQGNPLLAAASRITGCLWPGIRPHRSQRETVACVVPMTAANASCVSQPNTWRRIWVTGFMGERIYSKCFRHARFIQKVVSR